MKPFTRYVLFTLFFVSGFSSLVYQVVWTRMAFASFGIITPVLSVVLSVFMLGLALGSWAGGRWVAKLAASTGWSAAIFYAGAEFVIGLGAFAVPKLFAGGEKVLLASGETNSLGYLTLSAVVLAASILPWCLCMGTTFPFMMAYIREQERDHTQGFSFLYLANVMGAMSGTLLAALVYIELLGFQHTLWVAAAGNFAIAFISICLGVAHKAAGGLVAAPTSTARAAIKASSSGLSAGMIKWILFSTGFVSMAMEVVWTRAFTPVLKTQVYSFAMIVFVYLGATFLGSWTYRRDLRANRARSAKRILPALAWSAFFPVLINTPRIISVSHVAMIPEMPGSVLVLGSMAPFCAVLGYLTPGLIDEYADGKPEQAGKAYAINVLGCILGPLFACYLLLPWMSERLGLVLLSLPFLVFCYQLRHDLSQRLKRALPVVLGLELIASTFFTQDFSGRFQSIYGAEVRRDFAATVISFGKGWERRLLVNGIGMTTLTPITKFMVHLPMAFHKTPPKKILVICFGMGTSYRSALSWGVDTTAVELAPSVPKAFGYYHADAAQKVSDPHGHIIVDDGRRFLKRSNEKFDVIVVDPPPPLQAAGSSLLYSREFYELAKQHLNPGGILQMWVPTCDDPDLTHALLRSICESFTNVRCFSSVEGWGLHMLGSMDPIEPLTPAQLVARMPPSARRDLMEWSPKGDLVSYFESGMHNELVVSQSLDPDLSLQVTDDEPYNEYYLLRLLFEKSK